MPRQAQELKPNPAGLHIGLGRAGLIYFLGVKKKREGCSKPFGLHRALSGISYFCGTTCLENSHESKARSIAKTKRSISMPFAKCGNCGFMHWKGKNMKSSFDQRFVADLKKHPSWVKHLFEKATH